MDKGEEDKIVLWLSRRAAAWNKHFEEEVVYLHKREKYRALRDETQEIMQGILDKDYGG